MKAITTASMFACVCIAACSYGQGTLGISFDGPPTIPPGASYSVTNYYESGMSFRPVPPQHDFSRVGAGYPTDPQDGTGYLRAALTESLTFAFTNGSVFDLVSVDLAEYSTGFQEPVMVHFVGYHQDGSIVIRDFTTDGIIDGSGPLADFQTFYFDNQFTGLIRVEIPTSGWSLDNLSVSVPEPTVGGLLAGGALTLVALRLRNWREPSE